MTSRTLKRVALIFLGSIGSAALLASTLPSHADDCVTAPKGATPQGSHWYYHLERGTGRKCWYLGTEGQKVSRNSDPEILSSAQKKTADAAPADSTGTADAAAETPVEPMQPSVANARAELRPAARPVQQPPAQQAQAQQAQQAPAPAGMTPFPVAADTAVAAPSSSSQPLGGRWPDTNAFRPTEQSYVIAQNAPPAPAQSEPAQTSPAARPLSTAQPAPAAQPAQAAQSVASPVAETGGITTGQIMLAAIFILLALAALTAGVAYRYFSRLKVKPEPAQRRDIWGQYRDDRIPDYEEMVMPDRRIRARPPAEPADEIEYLLRRASQREARQRHFSN